MRAEQLSGCPRAAGRGRGWQPGLLCSTTIPLLWVFPMFAERGVASEGPTASQQLETLCLLLMHSLE